MDQSSESWDVVIIGAGAAGLAAAEEVSKAGCKTLVLEARGRTGGRIYTVHDSNSPTPLELGAEFIHGMPESLLKIAHRGLLTYYDLADEHAYAVPRSESSELVPMPHFWEDLALVMKKARLLAERDRSFAEFLMGAERDPELRRFLPFVRGYVEGFHAADPRALSLKALSGTESEMDEANGRRISRFLGGYDQVIQWLEKGAKRNGAEIRLNTVVYEINWSHNSVELQVRSRAGMQLKKIHARKVIVTIPLSLLHASVHESRMEGAIRFNPPLREKRDAVDHLKMGPVMKVLLRFRSRFWEKAHSNAHIVHQNLAELAFIHHAPDPDVAFPTWWTQKPIRAPLLTAWAGGPQALELGDHTEEGLVEEAIRALALISGFPRSMIEEELDGWAFHDWQSDPYARGAYSFVAVNGVTAQRELAEPMQDTLFIAGEATHFNGQSGTVDGAIDTGVLAGQRVVQALLSSGPTESLSA
ncbi:MAG: flavin monoamine oxidase family protein [Bdellovibrionia bacterium]